MHYQGLVNAAIIRSIGTQTKTVQVMYQAEQITEKRTVKGFPAAWVRSMQMKVCSLRFALMLCIVRGTDSPSSWL